MTEYKLLWKCISLQMCRNCLWKHCLVCRHPVLLAFPMRDARTTSMPWDAAERLLAHLLRFISYWHQTTCIVPWATSLGLSGSIQTL